MLKLLEEPPASTVFIFCTTDPQKIPRTILSRVQRYNFQRISKDGIVNRLKYIIDKENSENLQSRIIYEEPAIDYIAKQAQGGMRDAITTLDKCLQYSKELTLNNVVKVLSSGVTPYELFDFTKLLLDKNAEGAISKLNEFFMSGIDMSLLLNMYFDFLLNLQKYLLLNNPNVSNLPIDILQQCPRDVAYQIREYIQKLYNVMSAPKMDIKALLEAWVIERCI